MTTTDHALRDALEHLEQIAKDMEYAIGGGMAWIDQSEAAEFCRRIRKVSAALAPTPTPDGVEEAIARIRRYVWSRTEMPIRGAADLIHGVHSGTEWEGELHLSDLRAILPLLQEKGNG